MTIPIRIRRELKQLRYELEGAARQVPYLRAMIEGTSDLLMLVDGEGLIVEYNQMAYDTLSQEGAGLLSSSVFDLFLVPDSDDGDKASSAPLLSREDLKNSNESSTRHWGTLKTGEAIELDISGLSTGEDNLAVISARLMNRQDRRERELLDARRHIHEMKQTIQEDRQREQAARMSSLSTLAGALSHDLNNALVVVCGNLDLLEEITTDKNAMAMLEDIRTGAESAREITTRFVTFSKGPGPLLKPLAIAPWLYRISHAFRASHSATINIDCADEQAHVAADEYQLTQVLLNLLLNAVQSAETKTPIDIVVKPYLGGGLSAWSIKVLDRGPGIETDLFPRLFDPFFTTKPGGTGLGLASAWRIVQEHEGELLCRNRDDGGAEFEIRLRDLGSEKPTLTPTSKSQNKANAAGGAQELNDIRVVLMDDEPAVLQTVSRMLKTRGAEVHSVASGEEVLTLKTNRASEWAQDDRTLVYVLDILVNEGLGGIETLRQLKIEDENVCAVACSGHAPLNTNKDFRTLGFMEFLAKPFRARELVTTLRLVCDEKRSAYEREPTTDP